MSEVVLFTCGLMPDCSLLADWIYHLATADVLDKIRTPLVTTDRYLFTDEMRNMFQVLYRESQMSLPGLPLHNKHVHWFQGSDAPPISVQAKVYVFHQVENIPIPSLEKLSEGTKRGIDGNHNSIETHRNEVCKTFIIAHKDHQFEATNHRPVDQSHGMDRTGCSRNIHNESACSVSDNLFHNSTST